MPSQETIFATEYKSIPAQIGVDEAQGIVECFVAGIGNKDSVGDICLPGSFNASLKRRKPRVVWGHNWNEPIGKVLEIYEVPPNDPRLPMKMKRAGIGGLYARVQFNLRSERGREAFNNVAFFGEEQEWSIGYKTLDAVFDPVQQANMLKEVELYEVSPVLHGANQLTGTISIKSDNPEEKADQPCWPGYQQVGMKKGKNGKIVPNCVPADGEKSAEERIRDPKGGLTAAGRKYFKRKEGANLKPGVKGPADTPEKMRRKGSFLTRFYTNPSGPLVDDKGRPTRLALAAAAWGEPVPKTRSDAAELAAKGRRMLERYENSKQKGHPMAMMIPNRIYEDQDMANPSSGFVGQLAREISRKFNGKVKIRTADKNMVIFDLMNNAGDVDTLRLGYHYEDGEFMFGNIEPVRPETIYMPVGKPQNMPGNAYVGDDEDDFGDVFGGVSMKPAKGDCGCGCKGSGSCGSEPNFESWDDFKSANPGMHLFVKSDYDDNDLLDYVAPIAKYHGFAIKTLTDGIVIPYMDDIDDEGYGALINALNGIDEKGVGRKLRALGRMANARFDPNARDADADELVQEGTQFERPSKPRSPQMMPPMRPRPAREPQREPIKPPLRPQVPSTPRTPVRPSTPQPVREPARTRVAGSMGGKKKPDWANPKPVTFIPGRDGEMVIPGNPGMSKRMTDARIYRMRAERVMSLDEVAKQMNMSRADVRQAEMRHMQAMRNAGIIGDETDKEKLARKIYERRMANKESLEQVAMDLGMKREQVRQLEMRHAAKLRDSQEKMDAIIMRGGGNPKGKRVSGSMSANNDPRKRIIPASQFTRSQNQAIDWARKQRGFRIAQRIIERFDADKALIQSDIEKLQQLMREYGPG